MSKLIPHKGNLCSKYATKMISIKINNNCNRFCSFCIDRGGRNGNYISIDDIAKNGIFYSDYRIVIITGGEPFLDFDKIVELAKRLRPYKQKIILNTNGTLLTKEKTIALNGLIDELQVSIHHYDENRNNKIFGGNVSFENIKKSLENKLFSLSINSNFTNEYTKEERPTAIHKMTTLCKYLNADRLRLTETKKVCENNFVLASEFFPKSSLAVSRTSNELITKGCTFFYNKDGIQVSVKRLCDYAKGEDAIAFSCCFIDTNGQKKIDVDTVNTFKVIYSDGLVTDDWVFEGI